MRLSAQVRFLLAVLMSWVIKPGLSYRASSGLPSLGLIKPPAWLPPCGGLLFQLLLAAPFRFLFCTTGILFLAACRKYGFVADQRHHI